MLAVVSNAIMAASLFEGFKDFANWLCQPPLFLLLSVASLTLFLVAYRRVTKPAVAAAVGVMLLLFFLVALLDSNFRRIATSPDNVAIVLMLFAVAFFLWLGFRRAALNDDRIAKGQPRLEPGPEETVLVWPDLVFAELIVILLATAALTIWAILLPAPLEQPADPSLAPNPAKAPWYFLGMQELLVYFDPWLAGVVFPVLIVVGLMAIPYLDKNPRGNGYYTFKERPLAISTFIFGFVVLWVMLIVFGTFLRGPNWGYFGPFEAWDPQRPATVLNTEFHDLFWGSLLGRNLPSHYVLRELPGITLLAAYFLAGPALMKALFFRETYRRIGFIRYSLMSMLLLGMLLLPIKMVLRWTVNLHYLVAIPEWSLNI